MPRCGEILRQAGRKPEAAEAFKSALKAMETLPAVRRRVSAVAELEKRIRTALAEVDPSAAPMHSEQR